MTRAPILVAGLLAGGLAGCRDGVTPFTPPPIERSSEPLLQLTFNVGDERDPQWSSGSDTIYFHSDTWYAVPGYRGTLLQVPSDGGIATRFLPAAQPNSAARLMLPVPSYDAAWIAYLHLRGERIQLPNCMEGDQVCPIPAPVLDSAALRVRAAQALTSTFDDVGITVGYPSGTTSHQPPFEDRVFPFHLDYLENNEVVNIRPSWAPDGESVAYSDGTRLLRWQPGAAESVEIPNTADGVAPAWSPDGQWIAFGIIERGAQRTASCTCGSATSPIEVTRNAWEIAARRVALVRPDGSDLRILTDGSEPAWTPDGSALFFRRGEEGLFRIAAAGGAATAIANTAGARAPAISPDGTAVAFARRTGALDDFNIWRLRLSP
jgi:Tol biopolymer transport system component